MQEQNKGVTGPFSVDGQTCTGRYHPTPNYPSTQPTGNMERLHKPSLASLGGVKAPYLDTVLHGPTGPLHSDLQVIARVEAPAVFSDTDSASLDVLPSSNSIDNSCSRIDICVYPCYDVSNAHLSFDVEGTVLCPCSTLPSAIAIDVHDCGVCSQLPCCLNDVHVNRSSLPGSILTDSGHPADPAAVTSQCNKNVLFNVSCNPLQDTVAYPIPCSELTTQKDDNVGSSHSSSTSYAPVTHDHDVSYSRAASLPVRNTIAVHEPCSTVHDVQCGAPQANLTVPNAVTAYDIHCAAVHDIPTAAVDGVSSITAYDKHCATFHDIPTASVDDVLSVNPSTHNSMLLTNPSSQQPHLDFRSDDFSVPLSCSSSPLFPLPLQAHSSLSSQPSNGWAMPLTPN